MSRVPVLLRILKPSSLPTGKPPMKNKPLHPSQKLVTAGEVMEMFEKLTLVVLDQRYEKRATVPEPTPSDP